MHQKEIIIINLYAPNISEHIFIKYTLKELRAHIDSNTVVVGCFNTPLSATDKSSKQKLNKEIIELNDTINQMYLTDVYIIQQQYNIHSSQHPMELSPK
jgi:hypothetical protein